MASVKTSKQEIVSTPSQSTSEVPASPEFKTYQCLSNEELRERGAKIGYRVTIHPSAIIENPEKLCLEDDVQIGPGVCIRAAGGVSIGERTILGPGARVLSSVPTIPCGVRQIRKYRQRNVKITIMEDAYIGPGVTVMPGAQICTGTVVESNAVVKGYIQPYKLLRSNCHVKHLNRTSPIDKGW